MDFEQKLGELHRNARRIAFHYAVRKGGVPPRLAAIVEATRAPHLFFAHYAPPARQRAKSPDQKEIHHDEGTKAR